MNNNNLLSEFITNTKWSALPKAVQRKIRMCMLDSLGATLAGTLTSVSKIAAEYAIETWPRNDATILLYDKQTSIMGAAFANAYAANGLDIDDCALYTRGHPGAQIFPTSLAIAEKLGLGGQEMLTAMVIGYEIAHRTARCWHDHHHTFQACGSWGSVACSAVASNLIGLPMEKIKHALGIAEYHAPNLPMMRDIDHPTMVKHGIGWGAITGITAAELAKREFTGISSILNFEKYQDWVKDVGQHYIMVDGVIWKEYACCAWAHPPLNAAHKLLNEHDIQIEDITRIRVKGFHEAVCLGTELPTTTEEAQFNIAWPLAVYLLDREVGPDQMLEHRFSDQRVQAMVRKIELVESKQLNELYQQAVVGDPSGKYAGALTITMKDGRRLDSGVVSGTIGSSESWDKNRMEEKFHWLAKHVLSEPRIEKLIDMAWHFEDVNDVNKLTRLLIGH